MGESKAGAARLLRVSRPTIYQWLEDGTLEEDEGGITYMSMEHAAHKQLNVTWSQIQKWQRVLSDIRENENRD